MVCSMADMKDTSEGLWAVTDYGYVTLLPAIVGCPANWACESDTWASGGGGNPEGGGHSGKMVYGDAPC